MRPELRLRRGEATPKSSRGMHQDWVAVRVGMVLYCIVVTWVSETLIKMPSPRGRRDALVLAASSARVYRIS